MSPEEHQRLRTRRFRLTRRFDDFVEEIFDSDSDEDIWSQPVRWITLINEQSNMVRGALPNPTTSRTDASTDERQNDARARRDAVDRQSTGTIDAEHEIEEGELGPRGEGPQSSHDEKPGDKGVKPAWAFR